MIRRSDLPILKKLDGLLSTRVFKGRDILVLPLIFIATVIVLSTILMLIREHVPGIEFSYFKYWPIGVFNPRLPGWQDVLVMVIVLLLFLVSLRYLPRANFRLPYVIAVAIVLVLGTNLIQGWLMGFAHPISGGVTPITDQGMQYYHDAIRIEDPFQFLTNYERLQPNLHVHSRTHPPGAVLIIYFLLAISGTPVLTSIAIAITAVFLSVFFMHGIITRQFKDNHLAGYVAFLFILIPSIQIYYATSIDAPIAGLLLGALYFFTHPRASIGIGGCCVLLFLSSFLTFMSVFIFPVIAAYEVLVWKSLRRTLSTVLGLGLIYLIVYLVADFNYVHSFLLAAARENPNGFRLLYVPAEYFFTRLTGFAEIILFFGPFLSVLFIRGLRSIKNNQPHLFLTVLAALFTLLGMFAAGISTTGEASRPCLFIYPYLVIPVASYLQDIKISLKEERILSFLVFGQAVMMQAFGWYWW